MPKLNVGKWCGYCGSFKSDENFMEHLHVCEMIRAEEIRKKNLFEDKGKDKNAKNT